MNKQEILIKYNDEDKLLLSKIIDKIQFSEQKNKIMSSDFLNLYEQKIIQDLLIKIKEKSYIFYGGYEDAERKILVKYPEKLNFLMENKNYNIQEKIKVIRIELNNEMRGKYLHKDYLGGIMKLGIKRQKIGDIIVDNNGADILVCADILNFLLQELKYLKRFSKSNIEEVSIYELKENKLEKEQIKITVPSLRLDCIIAELINVSRNKASEIILSERVFINYVKELKISKEIKIEDTITIRGKGRFTIKELVGISKKNKQIILVEKFKR